jgi:hypothetical protein
MTARMGRTGRTWVAGVAASAWIVAATAAASDGKPEPEAVAPAAAVKQMVSGPEVRGFRAFCDEWMQKLRERERWSLANLKWERQGDRVAGEYVAYGQDCTCIAREEPGKDPIGKITYRETRMRREGATPEEALAGTGTIVEQSDVTEIFRFGKGRWQY